MFALRSSEGDPPTQTGGGVRTKERILSEEGEHLDALESIYEKIRRKVGRGVRSYYHPDVRALVLLIEYLKAGT